MRLAPLPTMAFNDPSTLDDVLRQGYAEIDAKANIYTPEELQAKKDGFATLVASAAVTGTVSRARRPEEPAEIQQALTTNPGLIEALDDRGAAVAKELDEAKRLREEAEALLGSYKQRAADAQKGLQHALGRWSELHGSSSSSG